jgi:hypothetical protein
MRWTRPLAALALSALGACGVFQPATGTTTGGTTPDAGTDCATAGNCQDCVSCALDGPCATLYADCEGDSDCAAIDQCVALGDTQADCEANNPNGASAWQAVSSCVYCTSCPNDCPGQCM